MKIRDCCSQHELGVQLSSMEPQAKARWVAALHSGNYRQATGALRTRNGYCCWGVLCDSVDPDGWSQDTHLLDDGVPNNGLPVYWFTVRDGVKRDSLISRGELAQWVGIHSPSDARFILHLLANANDGNLNNSCPGHTFAEIADWIEEYL